MQAACFCAKFKPRGLTRSLSFDDESHVRLYGKILKGKDSYTGELRVINLTYHFDPENSQKQRRCDVLFRGRSQVCGQRLTVYTLEGLHHHQFGMSNVGITYRLQLLALMLRVSSESCRYTPRDPTIRTAACFLSSQ
ncbi:hypothetical protein JEQ12_019548 [Ovis aries]|uniref:Uncharacterized protein n=1 Tax=Ovis aries TaxID=9940 RepID=A0A836A7L1_SHEEP|nr:hypothetical protein JEQ12_019548 [Ovis aries]